MEVKPMSPSANFTTYRLPASSPKSGHAFAERSYNLPRPKATISSSLFRFLLCSRPCFQQHSVEMEEKNHASDLDEENGRLENFSSGDSDCQLRTELQVRASASVYLLNAVMRHLEVRWQLFNEALSRFGDLEAMLAICAEKVKWRHHTSSGVKDSRVEKDLRSLIARKLSMEVRIQQITQFTSTGELGASLDQAGLLEHQLLHSREHLPVRAAVEFFSESLEEIGSQSLRSCVIEEDTYILCNQKGELVEEGKQVVLWEQYNATWYIRGCVSYPTALKLKLHA